MVQNEAHKCINVPDVIQNGHWRPFCIVFSFLINMMLCHVMLCLTTLNSTTESHSVSLLVSVSTATEDSAAVDQSIAGSTEIPNETEFHSVVPALRQALCQNQ